MTAGNDTFAGIWEMVGLPFRERFSTYDPGLPLPLLNAVEDAIGRKVLGNCYGPGSELKRHYADEHRATGHPILYTSDDGVVQIAAHEEVILPEELYKMAERMTEVLRGHGVARIIARPFIGQEGKYKCTDQRADFPVPTDMPEEILLDLAARHGVPFIATSHIRDLFSTRAVTESIHIADNADGISKLLGRLRQDSQGIMFFGLLDFDEYGHKKDPCGYARALEAFDMHIPDLIQALRDYDMLVFTADHGTALTSYEHVHTREYVPLLVLGPRIMIGVNLGIRQTFADLGQTIADILSLGRLKHGKSFADAVICYQRPDIVH